MRRALTPLERAVLEKLCSGDHPVWRALRRQAQVATVASRELTGVGFFTTLELPPDIERAPTRPGRLHLGDVEAVVPGLRNGAGFVLFVQDGIIELLEGYSYDEPWPEQILTVELRFLHPGRQAALQALA